MDSVLDKLSKFCIIPQRFVIAILVMAAISITYLLRVFFITTGKYMIANLNTTSMKPNGTICDPDPTKNLIRLPDRFSEWSLSDKEAIDLGFFLGYMLGHIPGGILSDLFGGKHVMIASIFGTSFITIITPSIQNPKDNTYIGGIIVLRFFFGIFIGMLFPSAHSIISQWAPKKDRGKMIGIIFSAPEWAIAWNNAATHRMIIALGRWSGPYYLYSSLGLIFIIIWYCLGTSYPGECQYLSETELIRLEKHLAGHVTYGRKKIPWMKIFQSVPVWALIFAQIGHLWIWHGLIYDLPQYLRDVLRVDILKSDSMACVPYAVMGCTTIILGFVSDFLINQNYVTVTILRKTLNTFGAMGPATFILAAGYYGYIFCSKKISVSLFTIGVGFMSCYNAGARANFFDLAPNYSGTLIGLGNGLAAIVGIVAPRVCVIYTETHTMYGWIYVFWIHMGVLIFTNIIYVFFSSGEEQSWNNINKRIGKIPSVASVDEDSIEMN